MLRPVRALILLAWLVGCSGEPPEKDPYKRLLKPAETAKVADAGVRSGAQKMADELRRIAAGVATHPYFGTSMRDAAEKRIEALPPQAGGQERVRLLVPLALTELSLGDEERAVALMERARQITPPHVGMAANVAFHGGVAWLRLGEVRNCRDRHTPESCIAPIRGGGLHLDKRGSEGAIDAFSRVIAHPASSREMRLAARWLLNIAAMTLDRWPAGVAVELRVPPEAFGTAPFPRLENISATLGVDRNSLAGGAIADDFDGDGDLDLVVSSWDLRARIYYYRNDGGRFVERGVPAGLADTLGGLNMEHADYDGDGDLDLFVLRGAWLMTEGEHPNSLLQNRGDGTFVDVTIEAGLLSRNPTQTAAFGDYDNDGDLDLYVGNESAPERPRASELFRNDGDGTFTNVTRAAGVENLRFAKGVAWGDIDEDDDLDLYVSNLGEPNRLYRNDGGTFTDIAPTLGVTEPSGGFPAWFWDFDNDGHLDIAAWHGYAWLPGARPAPPLWWVAADALRLPHDGELPKLYQGDGRGGFTDVTRQAGLDRVYLVMGSNWGDLDNDGWPDVYLGTGYPGYEGLMPNVALHNQGGRSFADVSASAGMSHLQKGHGVAFADFDQDGDQDVFAELGGAFLGDTFMDALFENPGMGNSWLIVELEGRTSNRFGMGARIRADIVEGDLRRSVHRVVDNGGTFGGNPMRQHLGLGKAARVERLEIYWPTSKTRQRFDAVGVNQRVRVVEGAAKLEMRPYKATPFVKSKPAHHHPK